MHLIDGNEVIKRIAERQDKSSTGIEDCAFYEAIQIVRNASTVEAELIKYGYWEWVDGSPDNYDLKCTVCGGVQDSGFWERCPYCGAKMKNGE